MHTIGDKQQVVVEIARKSGVSIKEFLDDTKKRWIIQELDSNQFNECKTAKQLGWHRNTLSREIHRLKIDVAQMRFDFQQSKKPVRNVKVAVQRQMEA